jgi:hypothetical protein
MLPSSPYTSLKDPPHSLRVSSPCQRGSVNRVMVTTLKGTDLNWQRNVHQNAEDGAAMTQEHYDVRP